ncbi:MAG: phosphoribosylpyrophosphate synthetase [Bdellovibrionales bacterium RIFOXYD12_FULL_39_22]|nr:MAG: phosphoribosylpyrophosphate synthetase [Bdellovibrionales bacterium RIFOXYB1_FULL_39_21]OFZ45168.1 MAG: phosphoribosylpyrophosphate synthetase [Bdellovibrionales bacterium RIFOXYC12_FULL_39_17]OFZ45640.1 MAG: phosphoribosylpyrophosphate synthetase [Bdellovibrionales bacterium RIFOXYC1_FULL_39_130]OFZ77502.1 MAG: phosphoribosylpyrophosphate synthetase [Bdellovibrionales bacterium RIFOXYD1_FULL_39_84]OFZ91631.1 MAG: phosphoribosylpyrophosphate synthetase [Bdellovibrionales bacterium RIFOX
MDKIVLVSGTSNLKLAQRISENLDLPLVDPQLVRFANGEIFCEIASTVRGAHVFVIQSTSSPVNDTLMELLIMIDALKRASASSITAVMPHYGYSRQDRKATSRSPISAKLVADILTVAGAKRVMTMDLHAGQIQGFFDIPFDNIYASPVFFKYMSECLFTDKTVCISPDSGGVERVRHYAKKLNCDLGMIDKRRVAKNVAKAMNIVGDVQDKECIIIDDIVDTAGTLIEACRALKDKGAKKVYACATHPVLSSPALDRIESCAELDRLVVTDTIPLSARAQTISKIVVLSTAEIFADAIQRTFKNISLSPLFIESQK